jgi:hypothetical protein
MHRRQLVRKQGLRIQPTRVGGGDNGGGRRRIRWQALGGGGGVAARRRIRHLARCQLELLQRDANLLLVGSHLLRGQRLHLRRHLQRREQQPARPSTLTHLDSMGKSNPAQLPVMGQPCRSLDCISPGSSLALDTAGQ